MDYSSRHQRVINLERFKGKRETISTFTDGLIGALANDGRIFITSPNVLSTVPEPPLGAARKLYLRKDYKYGIDNPIQWPQVWSELHCHLAVIPLRPRDSDVSVYSAHDVIWEPLKDADIVKRDDVLITELKVVGGIFLMRLKLAVKWLLDRLEGLEDKLKRDLKISYNEYYIHSYVDLINLSLNRLEHVPAPPDNLRHMLVELQRTWLILAAWMDFWTKYRPRMLTHSTATHNISDRIIGAFAENETDVLRMLKAGIPCWYIRPLDRFDGTVILKQVELSLAINSCTNIPITNSPAVIWGGPYNDGRKTDAMLAAAKCLFHYHVLYDIVNPHLPSIMNRPKSDFNTSASSSASRFHPYAADSRPSHKEGMAKPEESGHYLQPPAPEKFIEPEGIYISPAIPSWLDMNQRVDRSSRRYCSSQKPQTYGDYYFPHPGSLLKGKSWRCNVYLNSYEYFHTALLLRAYRKGSKPLSLRTWKKVLDLGLLPSKDRVYPMPRCGKVEPVITKTPYDRDRLEALLLVQEWFSAIDVANGTPLVPALLINEKNDIQFDLTRGRELFWELSELNFRFELHALDSRAARYDDQLARQMVSEEGTKSPRDAWDSRRQALLLGCFPGGSLIGINRAHAKMGLASPDWKTRLLYVSALWKVMLDWDCDIPTSWFDYQNCKIQLREFTEVEAKKWEADVILCYVQAFYDYFGRPATLPRSL